MISRDQGRGENQQEQWVSVNLAISMHRLRVLTRSSIGAIEEILRQRHPLAMIADLDY
jgi:hypothetical protein